MSDIAANTADIDFMDDLDAQQELAKIAIRKKRCSIGLLIAAVTEILYILGFCIGERGAVASDGITLISNAILIAAFVGTAASYVIGGGILTALKVFFGIIKWCWRLCPIIFLDIILVILGGIAGLLALIFAPLLYVFISWVRVRKEEKDIQNYLGYDKKAQEDAMARRMAKEEFLKENAQ